MFKFLLALALTIAPSSAVAAWNVATSEHFTVYSAGSDASVREAAAQLEKFHVALRYLSGAGAPSSPIRVTVFLVSDVDAVQAAMPFGGGGVAGFYAATLRGPYTIMSRTKIQGSKGSRGEFYVADMAAQQILFHELTHHFMRQYFPAAYPVWYSEGFAEYLGSIQIESNDTVVVGNLLDSRYAAFENNEWLSVRQLLTAKSYRDVSTNVYLLYSEGWLLVHYLNNAGVRQGQLRKYLDAVNKGTAFDQAAREAFGDLDQLDRELRGYASKSRLKALALPFKKLESGAIATRKASPAEEAMLSYDMRMYAGVPARDVGTFADKVADAARSHMADPYALRLAAEAQRLAGRNDRAAEFVDHWLEVAPDDGRAIAAKADLLIDRLAATGDKDAERWTAARKLYAEAAKKTPDDPRILRGFYMSYVKAGRLPPEAAQNALYRAFELMPQYDDMRAQVASDFEARGMIDAAIATIRPAAFLSVDPSGLSESEKRKRDKEKVRYRIAGETDGETAREMLIRLEALKAKSAK
ncbi:hypothetical protein [Sphingomonas sp. UNC305MFCol5.2]|uniref:hypothetical protein n=1 Tax=Sphingomonas sp. UNC305MFCol5.2 TaxID=1449076 RepID=UPI0004A7366E|nr:hypothetical protein [Sphingomonas sp. UNC305MFCol5.2]